MYNIHDICDYIIFKTKIDEDLPLNHLKLQKILYYVQSWHLAFYDNTLFDGKFEAWVHGPVNRAIYNRFKVNKSLYSEITQEDILNKDIISIISEDTQIHIDSVLETYMPYSGAQLELMSHKETPWLHARKGFSNFQYCDVELDEDLIKSFFKKKLNAK